MPKRAVSEPIPTTREDILTLVYGPNLATPITLVRSHFGSGVAIIALPVLRGWGWVTLISPVFVALLITCISGVPMLEKRADEKWGGQEDYEEYKRRTPVLIPRL